MRTSRGNCRTMGGPVKSVGLYRITLEGCVPLKKDVLVTDGQLVLSLGKDEAVSIVPAGTRLAGKILK